MRHYFGNIATSIEEASQKPGTPLDLRERLETAQLELLCALDELGEAKVNSSLHIGEVARKILELSQGYVFYSEEPQKEVDLWKCGLYRIKLESKITKDQLERGAMPASEESDRNVSVLLNALNGVDFRTHRVFLPVSHAIPTHYFPHKSYRPIGRPGSRWVSEDVQLKVHYESDCSRRIVN
jgi:hypothetical protein